MPSRSAATAAPKSTFLTAILKPGLIRDFALVNRALETGSAQVVDARSAYLPLDKGVAQAGTILAEVKSLLQQG